MKPAAVLFFLASFLLILAPATPARCQNPAPVVGKVRLEGLDAVPEKRARQVLSLRAASRKPWVRRQAFDPDLVEADTQKLNELLKSEGFFSGSARSEIVHRNHGRTVDVTFHVEDGPATLISGAYLLGTDKLSPEMLSRLKKVLGLEAGDRFRAEPYTRAKRDLLLILRDGGYATARVDGDVLVDRERREAEVRLTLSPGRWMTFGEVDIAGLDRTDPRVIRSRLLFSPGDPYSLARALESQRNLFSLGFLSTVTVEPRVAPEEVTDNIVPMEVSGGYRQPRRVRMGLGYGSEDRFRVQASWMHRHIGRMARQLELSAKTSSIVQRVEARMLWPWFRADHQELTDDFALSRDENVTYTDRTISNRVQVHRALGPFIHLRPGHLFEMHRLEEVSLDQRKELGAEGEEYYLSAIQLQMDQDRRRPGENPRQGSLVSLGAGYASRATGSSVQYFRITGELRQLLPLTDSVTLAARGLYTTIQPTEETDRIPIFKRLFSGGGSSVRGYAYQRLGPLDAGGGPQGGESMAEASLELRFPLYKELGGVVFSDAGMVLPDPFSFRGREIRATAGAGLRYNTPVGPLRVDLGFKLNPATDNEDEYQLHLSIGQAF
ncbi:MAG: BamA/TamA family outer membrane protein [Proteobacteria bacterium]|nr:BamA/TamA family outer membrane protein [Pseudomonadota bacterium]